MGADRTLLLIGFQQFRPQRYRPVFLLQQLAQQQIQIPDRIITYIFLKVDQKPSAAALEDIVILIISVTEGNPSPAFPAAGCLSCLSRVLRQQAGIFLPFLRHCLRLFQKTVQRPAQAQFKPGFLLLLLKIIPHPLQLSVAFLILFFHRKS